MNSPQPVAQNTTLSQQIVVTDPNPSPNPKPVLIHSMVTRFRVGTNRLTQRLNLHLSFVSPLPNSYTYAFKDPNWQNVMCDEYNALIKNKTWTLVPRPAYTNVVRCMWLFRHKYLVDGTLSWYTACLVVNGSTQVADIDVDETFSLVVKLGTIRTWSLYGLKQASRAWFQPFASYITRAGFHHSRCDSSLFVYRQGTTNAYLILYVDDILLTTSSETLLQQIISSLHQKFSMTDLGSLNYFLSIFVTCDSSGMLLSQRKYAIEILERAHMANCNPSRTPVDTESKLGDNVAYSDADWASCPTTRRSASGYRVFLGNNLLSWSSKHQPTLSRFSAEAEYRGVANAVVETCWLRNLLRELHTSLSFATLIYCDNISVIYLSSNQCTKHIETEIHFLRDLVAAGQVRVLHVP
ncbi:ribonuclease H-like domain-containing protein [Tanacetum coccineum]